MIVSRPARELLRHDPNFEAIHSRFSKQPDHFDLLISDQTMPHLTGIELAREALRIRPDLAVILCSGFSEIITTEGARSMGVREFVSKSFTFRELGRVIRDVLDARGM